jgi:dephospho-CoA kinase
VDRAALARLAFADPDALDWLESIVHPAVAAVVDGEIAAAQTQCLPILVIDAVKLVESELQLLIDELWIVTCSERQQMERLRAGRGMPESEARRRMAAQSTVAAKISRFHSEPAPPRPVIVVDNRGSLEVTRRQVERLWRGLPVAGGAGLGGH